MEEDLVGKQVTVTGICTNVHKRADDVSFAFILTGNGTSLPSRFSVPVAHLHPHGDEPERVAEDGTVRKVHYGDGVQPWDVMVKVGWAPAFAAGCVIKYLRRTKDTEGSLKKARWYWAELRKLALSGNDRNRVEAGLVLVKVIHVLTKEESDLLADVS